MRRGESNKGSEAWAVRWACLWEEEEEEIQPYQAATQPDVGPALLVATGLPASPMLCGDPTPFKFSLLAGLGCSIQPLVALPHSGVTQSQPCFPANYVHTVQVIFLSVALAT